MVRERHPGPEPPSAAVLPRRRVGLVGNFIDRIADRALGISPRVEPLVGSYFARSPAPDWLAVEPTVERTAPAPAGQRLPAAEGESSEPPGPDPPHLESTSPALTARTATPPGDAERFPAPPPP